MADNEIQKAKDRAKVAYSLLKDFSQVADGKITNEDFVTTGSMLWHHTYKGGRSDVEAFEALNEVTKDGLYPTLSLAMALPDEQCKLMWSARWVDQGCPRIIIDSKYASLLMATDVGQEMLQWVITPWKAFLIELPYDLLTIENPNQGNRLDGIRRIMVHSIINSHGKPVWNLVGLTDSNVQLWRHGMSVEELTKASVDNEVDWDFGIPVTTRDDRAVVLMGKLVISTCVALSDPANFHKQKKTKGRGGLKARLSKHLTEIQTFVLGKPITLNCRQAILDYLDGITKSRKGPTVQFLVRGHWRHQAYGPKHSLRKLIHIEPFWKGDENANILARTVRLENPNE